jgi:tetratricopeptide (TPR) repeat protein
LEKIRPSLRSHPDVLELQWQLNAQAKNWEGCVDVAETSIQSTPERPEPWIHRSFALHELKRTQEALEKLLPVAEKFQEVWTIPYNLACYCAQLGRLADAKAWFAKASALDDEASHRAGSDDPDLKPLRDSLGGTLSAAGH